MSCEPIRPLLPRLAEREGSPRVALETARHLAVCHACAAELLQLRELNGLLDRLPQTEVPATFARRVLRALAPVKRGTMVLLLALAALLAGSVGGGAGSVARVLEGPLLVGSSALEAARALVLALVTLIRAGLSGESPTEITSFHPSSLSLPLPLSVLLLALVATLALAASGAALGGGALSARKEPPPNPPVIR